MKLLPWLEIAVFVGIVIADACGFVPLTQTIVLVPLIWLALRLQRQPWATIGFSLPPRLAPAIGIGLFAGIALEMFAVHVTTPMISAWFGVEPDYSQFKAIEGNLKWLAIAVTASWILAAFGEEICFRGFLMERLAHAFGNGRAAWGASLLIASVIFGFGHTEQGVSGWVQEGLSGFLLGALFLAARRNLAVPIVAHGVSNTVAFVLIFLGRYPGVG